MQTEIDSSRRLRGVLLEPAGVTDGSERALQHLDVHWKNKNSAFEFVATRTQNVVMIVVCMCVSKHIQCSSGSSLRRLGGTVVMRILTVASAELISKPVSLVSMLSTESSTHTVSCYINSRLNVHVSELSFSRSLAVVTFGRVLCAKGLHYFVAESSDSLHCERKTIFIGSVLNFLFK